MKKFICFAVLLTSIVNYAQQTGIILEKFGKVYTVEKPESAFENDNDKEYKVIFDVFTDTSNENEINPQLNAIVKYLDQSSQQGVPKENMKVVVIIHGATTKNILNNATYQKQFNKENPNSKLMHALKNADVELFVCGQSYLAQGFKLSDKYADVKLALSALTVLIEYQSEGYQLINFN